MDGRSSGAPACRAVATLFLNGPHLQHMYKAAPTWIPGKKPRKLHSFQHLLLKATTPLILGDLLLDLGSSTWIGRRSVDEDSVFDGFLYTSGLSCPRP